MRVLVFSFMLLLAACQPHTLSQADPNNSNIRLVDAAPSLAAAPAETPPETQTQWRKTIDGIAFDWDTKDLSVQIKEIKLKLFSEIAESHHRSLLRSASDQGCEDGHFFRLSSVVGNLVSFEHEIGFSCGAVTSSDWRYATIDVAKEGNLAYPKTRVPDGKTRGGNVSSKVLNLSELFSEDDILSAFLANKMVSDEISKALDKRTITSPPKTMADFSELFTKTDYSLFDGSFYLASDFLSRFAFNRIEAGKVAV